ncbi:MAG TPA: glycosyltransferase family 1 protein [Rhabdochlamydiaceae bacterium]|jgi:glycosyltransferase involved in cell wall biosynthesis|nr:glycosyltransferase family 1 protein [Rhabdochlamydiaceae bacterium]
MKELCIDVRMALSAGIGTYIRNIVPLLANDFKLRLIAEESTIKKWPFLSKCDLIVTNIPIYSIEEQIKFPFLVPACDIFWTPHYNTPFSRLKSKKRVVTIHDVYHLVFSHTLRFLQRSYAKIMIKRATKISDHIFTISQFSKSEIMKYTRITQDKLSSIHLGVDQVHFCENSGLDELTHLQQKYTLPPSYLIFVGTLTSHKNIERLMVAWDLIRGKFPEWKLVLVGKRGKGISWESSNPLLNESLLFLGQVDDEDLPGLYRNSHAIIHPSLYEGFGLTPLEAMSCGCPVVVSNAASLPEVCGDSALYIDPYNVAEIAAGMERVMHDSILHEELKTRGLQRSRCFTWSAAAEKYAKAIESLE